MADLAKSYAGLKLTGRLSIDFARCGQPKQLSAPTIDAATLRDRMRGALLGCAVGDAAGNAVGDAVRDALRGPAGAVSDDTQLTMRLAESLLARDGLDPEDVARRFTEEPIRGMGLATAEFVASCRRGLPWERCGVRSAGNGVAMRSAPVGLFYGLDFAALKLAAGLQALLTHNDPMAIASGILMAYATARLVAESPSALDPLDCRLAFCRDLAGVVEGMEEAGSYRTRKDGAPDTLHQRIGSRIPEFLVAGATAREVQEEFWSGAYVLESLPFALFCFLQSPGDFRRTLRDAVNLGKDADTTGAMACTLSGAYNGASAIPAEYLEGLEYRSQLEGLADRLAKRWEHDVE